MNRFLSGLVILFIVLNGCSTKDKAPGDIISKEKMEAVLWDIVQAERFTATYLTKDSSKNIQIENFKLYDQIFSIHQVKKDEFIKSYEFYLSRPDIARVLFDSLAARANRVREDMYKTPIQTNLPDSASKPTDSLRKADSAKIIPPLRKPDTQAATTVRKRSPLLTPLPQVKKADTGKTSLKPLLPILKPDTSKALLRKKMLLRTNRRLRDSLQRKAQ
jgi:hypothetical protein